MLREVHIAALHRVVVDVIQLLSHHGILFDALRVTYFLPELMLGLVLVVPLEHGQQLQQSAGVACLQVIDNATGGIGLEPLKALIINPPTPCQAASGIR
jgi:hypothetical protein